MASYTSLAVLILWIVVPETVSETQRLLKMLKETTWPWFGDKYAVNCPRYKENWPLCFNHRPGMRDSILTRVGIPESVTLDVELKVVFSAPAGQVDVCAEMTRYGEVLPFQLNADGFAIKELLQRGAEIYRDLPSVLWVTKDRTPYDLIFIDAGYLKIRGYMQNIHRNGSNMIGKVVWPYSAPANPALQLNPNLVVLVEYNPEKIINTATLNASGCVTKGLSLKNALKCRKFMSKLFHEVPIVGMQVFYTDGSSLFEQYRACTESLFCNDTCISKIRLCVRLVESSILFLKVQARLLDVYVNLNFISPSLLKYTACCETKVLDVRATPENNLPVDNTAKVYKHKDTFMQVELAGSTYVASDSLTYYSVVVVCPDVPKSAAKNANKLVRLHMWLANLRYQELLETPAMKILQDYIGPTLHTASSEQYFILLFSHAASISSIPEDMYSRDPRNNIVTLDFTYIPFELRLRGISWFKAKMDYYSVEKVIKGKGSCKEFLSSLPASCARQFGEVEMLASAPISVSLIYTVPVTTFQDPPDSDQFPPDTGLSKTTNNAIFNRSASGTVAFMFFLFWLTGM